MDTLLREGATVHYLSRSPAAEQEEWERRADEAGTAVHWRQTDVTDEEATVAAVGAVLAEQRRLDVLVNNAGITRDGLVMRMKRTDWDAVLTANLTATFVTCREVVRSMVRARAGSIINVSSVTGLHGNPGQTNYAASRRASSGSPRASPRKWPAAACASTWWPRGTSTPT